MIDSRIRWRCRRGIRELDVALQRFLEINGDLLTDRETEKFDELLDVPDPDLMDWIYNKGSPNDQELVSLVERIRDAAAHPITIQ